jgi:folate-dependent phosphoribosylglycinamide formyltransferase PurN
VTKGYDTGRVVGQRSVEVVPGDSLETLKARVSGVEDELLVDVLRSINSY